MNIIAALQMLVNNNPRKPLNEQLDELKDSTQKKCRRIVTNAVGIPYVKATGDQLITLEDNPVLSIEGSGRILQVIPVYKNSPSDNKWGTALLTIDDDIIFNGSIKYAAGSSSYKGYYIVDYTEDHYRSGFSSNIFGAYKSFDLESISVFIGDMITYQSNSTMLVAPLGIPFKNDFKIRMTQSEGTTVDNFGVIVVYELYE